MVKIPILIVLIVINLHIFSYFSNAVVYHKDYLDLLFIKNHKQKPVLSTYYFNVKFKPYPAQMSSISISKYQHLCHQITPAKVTVPHDINSWLETHAKQKLVYKYKPRKTLKKVDQNSHQASQNQPKLTNLAELRAYRQKLLKSSSKKMSDRCIPSPYSHANYSLELLKSKRSGLKMKIRSLSRPRQEQKEHIIVITQFEPNDSQPAAQLNLNFKFHNKMDMIIVKTLNSERETTLMKRKKTISRKSLKNNPEMTIGFPHGVPNPQEKGISLMSRRLLPSKA